MSVLLSCVLSRVRAWGNLRVPSRIKHTASCPEIIKSKPQWEGSLLPCFTVCTFRQCLSMNVKDLTHLWLYRTITVTTHRNLTSLGQWGSLFWDSFMGAWLVKWDGLSQHPRTARHREMSALTIQPSDSSLSGPRVCLNLCCILYIYSQMFNILLLREFRDLHSSLMVTEKQLLYVRASEAHIPVSSHYLHIFS